MDGAHLCLWLFLAFSLCQFQLVEASPPVVDTFLTADDFERAKNFGLVNGGITDDSSHQFECLADDETSEDDGIGRRSERSVVRDKRRRWENGRIPYVLDPTFSADGRVQIALAMKEIEEKTCIRFPERQKSDVNYISVKNTSWCAAPIGRKGGKQFVSVGGHCTHKGSIEHELLHAAGFYHEHSRPDRDDYVSVLNENVKSGKESNFMKHTLQRVDPLGTPYDFGSIMHYGLKVFSSNGQPTLVTVRPVPAGVTVGQQVGLSRLDVIRANLLYDCTYEMCERNLLDEEVKGKVTKWPRAEIPIEIDSSFSYETSLELAAAMADIMSATCILFLHRSETEEPDYIHIRNSGGCGSYVGRRGGGQDLFLGLPQCQKRGHVLHHLLHAIGFYHETGRWDRDDYVEIVGDNINGSCLGNFRKENESTIDNLRTGYDYGSIMHLSTHAGSKNGGETIRTLRAVPPGVTVGQRDRLSQTDIVRINRLYQCPQECNDTYTECNQVYQSHNCHLTVARQMCRMTCNQCNTDPPPDKKPTGDCKNDAADCKEQFHKCGQDRGFTDRCRLTCEVCVNNANAGGQ